MKEFQTLLLSYPPEYLLYALAGMIFLTSLGAFPGHVDSFLVVAGLLSGSGYIDLSTLLLVIIPALLLAETLMFSIGFRFGSRVLDFKLVKKLVPSQTRDKYSQMINDHPKKFLVLLRLTPAMRSFAILTTGSLKPEFKKTLWTHYLIAIPYFLLVIVFSYFVGNQFKELLENNKLLFGLGYIIVWLGIVKIVKIQIERSELID
jgi:membrane protein DedA with SNARE-associated domain